MPACRRNQYVRLISRVGGSLVPPLLEGAAPASLTLPNAFHSPSARTRTKSLGWRSPLFGEALVAAGAVATVVEKVASDYPRGLRKCLFQCGLFPVADALPVPPALPVAFLSAGRRRPVLLLGLPVPPLPCCLTALTAAIPLMRSARAEPPFAAFQQTWAGSRPGHRPLPSAGTLRTVWLACTILGRAHGRSRLPEAPAPERTPLLSGATAGIRFSATSTLTARHASPAFPRLGCGWSGSRRHSSHPADALAAIMRWHRGPSWRCHFGPSLIATNTSMGFVLLAVS